MQASMYMIVAFAKAQRDGGQEHIQWQDGFGVDDTTFTANLKQVTIDTIDLTEAKMVYELYRETELMGEFTVPATVDLTVWTDKLTSFNLEPVSLLNKGLKDGSIKQHTEGYYATLRGQILGLTGEEAVIETYLRGQANGK